MLIKRRPRRLGRRVIRCMNCHRKLKRFYRKIGSSYRCFWCHMRLT